jgi:uncharacterized surface protein with fasciclin (FAS1) repeats
MLETVPTLTNFTLTVTSSPNTVMIDNSTVIYPDLVVYNGVIHGINQVLVPPALTLTILDQLTADPQFSTFLGFLQVSDNITQVLNSDGPMTLFIPTNSAFELFDSTVDSSSFSSADVEMILEYHVALSNVFLNELENNTSIQTMNGQNITVSVMTMDGTDDEINSINNATVLDGGLASNGVVYVLEEVLLPTLLTVAPTSSPAPTFDGYIAPSNAPSAQPVMNMWPEMPSSATDAPTSSGSLPRERFSFVAGTAALFWVIMCL